MPELPEVETIRRGLEPLLTGRRVTDVVVRERRLRRRVAPAMLGRLRGAAVVGIRRRSKYLLVDTDAGLTMIVHLGMSGRLWVSDAARPARPHEHLVFALDDGRTLRFADPRRFGMVEVVDSGRVAAHPLLRAIGPEPLGDDVTGARMRAATRGLRKPVKNWLMDTRALAGVGNIYACEALHRAAIHPRRAVGRLGPAAWDRLVAAVKSVLAEAIEAGGTTLRDFFNAAEEAGEFAVALRVYDREGKACRRCRGRIRRVVLAGRATFYCPGCQR